MSDEGQPAHFTPLGTYLDVPTSPSSIFNADAKLSPFDTYVGAVNLSAAVDGVLPPLAGTGNGHTLICANTDAVEVLIVKVHPSDILNGFLIEGVLEEYTLLPGQTLFLRKLALTTPVAAATTTVWKILGLVEISGGTISPRAYGQMFGPANATQIIGAPGTFQKVTGYLGAIQESGAPWLVGSLASDDFTLGAQGAGDWDLNFNCGVTATAAVVVSFQFAINGAPILPEIPITPDAAADPFAFAMRTFAPGLLTGDTLEVQIAEAGGNNVALANMGFNVRTI